MRWRRCATARAAAVALLAAASVVPALAQDASSLRARHASLAPTLAGSAFGRPLALASSEVGERIAGDVHARLDVPFARAAAALLGPGAWCEILFLHQNVKSCRGSGSAAAGAPQTIGLVVGSKHDQPLERAHRLAFEYRVVASHPDYLRLQLDAADGPLGTSDYRIDVEVVALEGQRSFLRLSYAYRVGFAAKVAMQAYLSTLGRDKVGFTELGRDDGGTPKLVGGARGVVERNTMRYYLAIEAYLASLSVPPARQFEQRLADWQSGVERYPRQLHELDRAQYLALKRAQRKAQGETAGA